MKLRNFVGSKTSGDEYQEIEINVVCDNNYQDFLVFVDKRLKGSFKTKDIKGAINSERLISEYLQKLTGLSKVYSLNNFIDKNIYEIIVTDSRVNSFEKANQAFAELAFAEPKDMAIIRSYHGCWLVEK